MAGGRTPLQVVLDDAEYREIQDAARRRRMSFSESVRQALRRVHRGGPTGDADRKLEAVRAAARHEFPTGQIGEMLDEIERGCLSRDIPE